MDQKYSDGKQSAQSKLKNTVAKPLSAESKTAVSSTSQFGILTSENLTENTLNNIATWLTSLPRDSHVSRSVSRVNSLRKKMIETCGPRQEQLFQSSDRDLSFSKMFPVYCLTNMPLESSLTLLKLNTRHYPRLKLGLMTLGLITGAKESGFWPTPTTKDHETDGPKVLNRMFTPEMKTTDQRLRNFVKATEKMPTPSASPRGPHTGREADGLQTKSHTTGIKFGMTLEIFAKLFPTPTGQDNIQIKGKGAAANHPERGTTLGGAVRNWPTPTKQDGENNGGAPSQFKRNSIPLNAIVKIYPTPDSYSRGGASNPEKRKAGGHSVNLQDVAGGQLNPDWVDWLMGFPIGWTSLESLPESSKCAWGKYKDGIWWAIEPDVPRLATKIKNRVARLKAIGNGQVPLCMAVAYKLLSQEIQEGI